MTELSGSAKLTWLKALKNSERNWNWYRSLKGEVLRIAKSVLLKAGPLRMFRPVAPLLPQQGVLDPERRAVALLDVLWIPLRGDAVLGACRRMSRTT